MGVQRIEIDLTKFDKEPDTSALPILPTRNLVLFPGLTINFELGRETSLALAKSSSEHSMPIGIVCQTNPDTEAPSITTGLYKYGVVADVLNVFERPDGTHSALVRARDKFRILGRSANRTAEAPLVARVKVILDEEPADQYEFDLAVEQIHSIRIGSTQRLRTRTASLKLSSISTTKCCSSTSSAQTYLSRPKQKNKLLSKSRLTDRAIGLLSELTVLQQRMEVTRKIMKRAQRNMEEGQKNAFLQQQMEAIRETLYGDGDEADDLP